MEKVIVLRHDVDNIFGIFSGKFKIIKKILNYSYLALNVVNLRHVIPKYLSFLETIIDLERTYGAGSTFFFRPSTIPTHKFLKELKRPEFEIAYHSDSNKTFNEFYRGLKFVERMTNTKIHGFTKHGKAPVRGGGEWDERKFIAYGVKAGLKYLAQGVDHPDWELPQNINGLLVFGHHVTLRRVNIDQLKSYVMSKKYPLILVHPEEILVKDVREKFETLLTMGRCISVKRFIEDVLKIKLV